MLSPHAGGQNLIGRLPQSARTPAMHPSWPKRDQTAIAPLSAEQSYFRPFSRRAVGDGEHRIAYSVLLHGRGDDVRGERCAITTVHCAVHFFVHPRLRANLQPQNEMHSEKSRHSHTVCSELGWSDPGKTAWGRSSPTSQVARWRHAVFRRIVGTQNDAFTNGAR